MVAQKQYTIKEIADSLGIDKQKVYRFLKKYYINDDAHQMKQTMYFDDVAYMAVKSHFVPQTASKNTASNEQSTASFDADDVVQILVEQLRQKDRQLEEKDNQLERRDAQINHLQQENQSLIRLMEQTQMLSLADKKSILNLTEPEAQEGSKEQIDAAEVRLHADPAGAGAQGGSTTKKSKLWFQFWK